ncbi:MAG: BREX-3 system phosphatase PglZ [Candidatus Latescibacterota bacterium]
MISDSSLITQSSSLRAESWRSHILREFSPKVARLTLVADPDELLLEEGILEGIRERGFELIPFEDHVAFRYAYESKFRSRWDRGEQTDLVVVLRSQASELNVLPYDLLHIGRKLSFSLGDVFPRLSYPVITALDRGDLDALFEAQQRHAPGQLGDNATKEFILRHIFEIAPELIKQPVDLLRVLLRRHYRGQHIPGIIDERLLQLLRQTSTFSDWPLEALLPDREAFFAFLQERWPVFLDRLSAKDDPSIREDKIADSYTFDVSGPEDLPFEYPDIRVYMDNLFLEGLLQSVSHECAETLSKIWVKCGVQTDPRQDNSRRIAKLMENIRSAIPAEDSRYGEWFRFARRWAELALLAYGQEDANVLQRLRHLQTEVDTSFVSWLMRRYAGLINLPSVPPIMLHHLPRFLAHLLEEDSHSKVALLLVDGLSLDQWSLVREILAVQRPRFRFREDTLFAWIPTITSASRQAAFAGKPPIFFPNSIHTTDKEPSLWMKFWADQGLAKNEVAYAKGLGEGRLDSIEERLSHPKAKVIGLVIDKLDKIMHGMELGTAGMHNQVRQWAQQPYLAALLDLLLDRGFHVYLTSDHGNIEATGCGQPAEGAVADLRGKRVRIYPDAALREKVKKRFPEALEWDPIGLPDDYLPLLAPVRQAFVQENQRTVCHGGVSVEELIVPLVHIERGGE